MVDIFSQSCRVLGVVVEDDEMKPFTHVPDALKKRSSTGDSSKRLFCFLRSRTTLGDMGLHGLHVRKHGSPESPVVTSITWSRYDPGAVAFPRDHGKQADILTKRLAHLTGA